MVRKFTSSKGVIYLITQILDKYINFEPYMIFFFFNKE